MYSPHKHSYLQSRTSGINPRLINRTVALAREVPVRDCFDKNPPFLRLSSEQPNIPTGNVDVTKRPLGFGRAAMPLLRRQLHHTDPLVVVQALVTICEVIRDAERGYEAIDLRIANRLTDLLRVDSEVVRERTCMALTAIACLADGKEAIVKNYHLLVNLGHAVDDVHSAVRIKAACCLEVCSRHWRAADYITDHGFIPILIDCIYKDDVNIIPIHLETLYNLMYGITGVEEAIENGGFEAFRKLLHRDWADVTIGALKCLQRLLSYCEGKKQAYNFSIIKDAHLLLYHEDPLVYSAAASVIMFGTIQTASIIQAAEIKGLPDQLIKIAHGWHFPSVQIYSIKCLTNLCVHPKLREYLKGQLDKIMDIHVENNSEIKRYMDTLLEDINWIP